MPCSQEDDQPEEDGNGQPEQDVNNDFCVELPVQRVNFIIQFLGSNYYENLIASGLVCPQ